MATADAFSPTSVTQTSARFQGSVNPEGEPVFAWFEYGLTDSYGIETPQVYVGTGVADVAISRVVSGLSPGTTYHYRVAAEPGVAPTGDTFFFTVNPFNVDTEVFVDFGLDPKNLDQTTIGVAIGTDPAEGEIPSGGLDPNTVYFYRVRAVSAEGESVSQTQWVLTDAVGGATLEVGSGKPYATIDDALADATGGDTIVVFEGDYDTVSVTQAFTSIVRIVANGNDAVTINDAQHVGCENVYWGPGIQFTGASFGPSSGNHLLHLEGTDGVYFDSIVSEYAGAATGDCSPLWLTENADNTFAMGSQFLGGGVLKGYTGDPDAPSDWPAHARFVGCTFEGQSSDIWHFDGMTDWWFESCAFLDPNPVPIPAEHHDGAQVAYGSTLTLSRCYFAWSGANQNGNNQAVILGDLADPIANCFVVNVLVNGWNGCSMNAQGAHVKYRNVTTYGCKGVVGGPSSQQNEDFIMGGPGDQIDMMNVIAWKPYTNGSEDSIEGSHNLIESGASNITGFLTDTAFGDAEYVAAGSDFRPAIDGNLDGTGGVDADTPLWDFDGRGYGPTMSKGCYAPADVETPLVEAAGYTP